MFIKILNESNNTFNYQYTEKIVVAVAAFFFLNKFNKLKKTFFKAKKVTEQQMLGDGVYGRGAL